MTIDWLSLGDIEVSGDDQAPGAGGVMRSSRAS